MPRLRTAADYYISPQSGSSISQKAEVSQSEVVALQTMSHADLTGQWRHMFGNAAPHNLSKRLLIHALAYHIQVQGHGELKKSAKQMLTEAIAATYPTGKKQSCPRLTQSEVAYANVEDATLISSHLNNKLASHNSNTISLRPQPPTQTSPPAVTLSPGTRLMREWRGVVHVVDVVEGGFIWSGKPHRSLSAIARAITGVRWNGLAFFGLRKRKGVKANGSDSISSNTITGDASHSYDLERSPTLNGDASEADNLAAAAPITAHDILSPTTDPGP